jgi:hypothetical protein
MDVKYGWEQLVRATRCGWNRGWNHTRKRKQIQNFWLGAKIYADILYNLGKHPFHVFFDNFFTTIPLLDEPDRRNIRATGTVRENRMSKCPFISIHLRKRGTYDYYLLS